MSDFEQRTEEYGTAILKLVRVKESTVSNTRLFGNIVFSAWAKLRLPLS